MLRKYWVIKIFSNNWIAHESGSYQAQWQFLSLVYVVKIRERKRQREGSGSKKPIKKKETTSN